MADATPKISRFKRYIHRNYRIYTAVTNRLRGRLTPMGRLAFGGLVATGCLGIDTNRAIAYQAFGFLAVLVFLAFVLRYFVRFKFTAERILPRYGSVGARLDYKLLLTNLTKDVQRGLRVRDWMADPRPSLEAFALTPEPGEHKRNWFDRTYLFYRWRWLMDWNLKAESMEVEVEPVGPGDTVEVDMRLMPLRRGVIRLEAVRVACPEPLGLFRRLFRYAKVDKVLVLPKRYAVPDLILPGATRFQQGGVALASSIGESEEFVSLREYRHGDPLRHIHWKSWAKLGRPIVKEFQDENFVRHALVLDTFSHAVFSEVFEEAVSLAASFACSVQTQESLLDLLFVGASAYTFTIGRGVGQVEQVLEVLAGVQVCQDQTFETLERSILGHLTEVSGVILVLIDWDEKRRELVKSLQGMGVPITVFLIRPVGAGEIPQGERPHLDPQHFQVFEVGQVEEGLARMI